MTFSRKTLNIECLYTRIFIVMPLLHTRPLVLSKLERKIAGVNEPQCTNSQI